MEIKNESTEDKIINASFRVLEKNGISGTTTRKIANEAGVSEVTLFRKFKSKKSLLNTAKKEYTFYLLEKLDEIFDFDEDISLEDYLKSVFDDLITLSDNELSILKIGLEEIRGMPFEDKVLSKVADKVISRLSEFFKLQIKKGNIRNVNPDILALNIYSVLFESIVLWKIYGKKPNNSISQYSLDFLDILLNGIAVD